MAIENLEKSSENLEKSIAEIFDANSRYVIPLYQRNYAWGEDQIEALFQDIYEAWNSNPEGNYYIGSLVVLKRRNGDYEVIDGQQRLTTLSLLTKMLGISTKPVLTYESRPEVERFFEEFYAGAEISQTSQTYYLREAMAIIKKAKIDVGGAEKENGFEKLCEIKDYLARNVILVRVEIPEDTDVASYFEIMNNRGEQLQKHEILKARLMNVLDEKYHAEFDLIWTACSNIDTPIQQCFGATDRAKYFGIEYDTFCFNGLTECADNPNDVESGDTRPTTIDDILEAEKIQKDEKRDDTDKNSDKISSIIDFPNFLMHVLMIYAEKKHNDANSNKPEVKLNEKFLLSCADELFGKQPDNDMVKEFIALLFKCRALFDRYVIKVKGVEDDEEFKWVLNKPNKGVYSDKVSVKYDSNTYADKQQSRFIMAQSMLQATFRQRIYKNWLQNLLVHLDNQDCALHEIEAESILKCLHKHMKKHFKDLKEKQKLNFDEEIGLQDGKKYKCLNMGVNTPHFLLNFIDYLYWVKYIVKPSLEGKGGPRRIENFEFRYYNSVEHHLARKKAEEKNLEGIVDCLGNLFMISKNANSRLSDRDVKEKVEMSKDGKMGANRQIIYKMTKDNNYNWGERDIINHYEELDQLLKDENINTLLTLGC